MTTNVSSALEIQPCSLATNSSHPLNGDSPSPHSADSNSNAPSSSQSLIGSVLQSTRHHLMLDGPITPSISLIPIKQVRNGIAWVHNLCCEHTSQLIEIDLLLDRSTRIGAVVGRLRQQHVEIYASAEHGSAMRIDAEHERDHNKRSGINCIVINQFNVVDQSKCLTILFKLTQCMRQSKWRVCVCEQTPNT